MKVEQIQLGVSPLTDEVFAGRINKAKNKWLEKVNVTDMFTGCVIQKFGGHITEVEDDKGNKYEITVKKLKPTPQVTPVANKPLKQKS